MENKDVVGNVVPATKGGRCFNGAHRDTGQIIHAVPPMGTGVTGYWGGKALCGTEPGLRGYGWTNSDKPVNCEKCLKKMSGVKKLIIADSFADGLIKFNTKGALVIPANLTKERGRILHEAVKEFTQRWYTNNPNPYKKREHDMQMAMQWLVNQINKRWSQSELYQPETKTRKIESE